MKLGSVKIKNFRSILETSFELSDGLHALVGGNESGKSNVLRAIQLFLSTEPLSEDDRYQLSEDFPEIVIKFNNFTPDEQGSLNTLFGKKVQNLVLQRINDDYSLIEPTLPEEVVSPDDVENPEITPDPEAAATAEEAEPDNTESVLEQVLGLLPDVEAISSPTDLISCKGFTIAELYTKPYPEDKKGKIETMLSFLELGDIDEAQVKQPISHVRNKLLKSGAKKIGSTLRSSWKQEDILIDINADNTDISVYFYDGKNVPEEAKKNWDDTKWISTLPDDRSDGFRWYVTFYVRYLSRMKKTDNVIFLIDDVGHHLNKVAQKDLLVEFETIMDENPGVQIIYTSHSPFMVDWDMRKRILLADKKGGAGTKVSSDWLKKFKLEELPSPLTDIGVTWGYDILGDANLITEGFTDGVVLHRVVEVFQDYTTLDHTFSGFRIIPAGKADLVGELAHLSRASGKKEFLLFDSDEEGLRQKGNVDSDFPTSDLNTLSGNGAYKIISIEDLVPRKIFLEHVNESGVEVFGDDWEEIKHVSGFKTVGIWQALNNRLSRKFSDPSDKEKIKQLKKRKGVIIQNCVNAINYSSYDDEEQRNSVKNFFDNLKVELEAVS